MIRRMEARDKTAVLGLARATGFFTAGEVGVAEELMDGGTRQFYIDLGYKGVARVPEFFRAGDDRVIYAKYFR